MTVLSAGAPSRSAARPCASRPAAPARSAAGPAGILALQRAAGNRAVATSLAVQRNGPKPPAGEPTPIDDSQRIVPTEWGPRAMGVLRGQKHLSHINFQGLLLYCRNGLVQFDGAGTVLTELAGQPAYKALKQNAGWYLGTKMGDWFMWMNAELFGLDEVASPIAPEQRSQFMKMFGSLPIGSQIILSIQPDSAFKPTPKGEGNVGESDAAGEGDGAWATGVAAKVGASLQEWRPAGRRSVLVGKPKVWTRKSDRTGWHLRIELEGEQTEISIKPGESQKKIDGRARAAVQKLRDRYDPAAAKPSKELREFKKTKHDPNAKPPPEWYREFEVHPSQKNEKRGLATAPALPAHVELQASPAEQAPNMVADAAYDFEMSVHFTPGAHGVGLSWSYDYYWEVLAASPKDWHAVAGLPDPDAPAVTPADTKAAADVAKSDPTSAQNQATGSGKQVTRYESATRDTQYTKRDASRDINATWDDDRTNVAGEAVAGGFKVTKTWVIDVFSGLVKKDRTRNIRIPAPGYYLVRCTAWNGDADEGSEWVPAASVDARPVKVVDSNRVAAKGATEELEKAGGKGGYARYTAELEALRRRLRGAKLLAARRADPSKAVEALGDAELDKLARQPSVGKEPDPMTMTEGELEVRAATVGVALPDYVASLKQRIDQLTDDDHESEVGDWFKTLKAGEGGTPAEVGLGASFVKERTGERVDLMLMLGQHKDKSSDLKPHWLLYDITTSATRDKYEGTSTETGALGHLAAIRQALRNFAGGNAYGRGTIGIAWPPTIGSIPTGMLPTLIAAQPDAEQRRKSRHRAYVEIATLIIPVAKLAKLQKLAAALEAFAAVRGGINAIEDLKKRVRTGHLYDIGTLLEVLQVVGAARAAGSAGTGAMQGMKVVQEGKRVKDGISLVAKLDTGIQTMVVGHSVIECLDQASKGTERQRILHGTYCIAKGIHDGTATLHAGLQQHETATETTSGRVDSADGGLSAPKEKPKTITADGAEEVKVRAGGIEVCPIQRTCPSVRTRVGGKIRNKPVRDNVKAAEDALGRGDTGAAGREARDAVDAAGGVKGPAGGRPPKLSKGQRAQVALVDQARARQVHPEAAVVLDDLDARIRDPKSKLSKEDVDRALLAVPAIAEIGAQRRAWENDPSKKEARDTLANVEAALRDGRTNKNEALDTVDRIRRDVGGESTAPTGTVRDRLTTRHPDIAARFAAANEKVRADFDAAMAVLEQHGMGAEGRRAVESLFRPGQGMDTIGKGRFEAAVAKLRDIAALVQERPDLATAQGGAQTTANVAQQRDMVLAAYEKGVTLENRPIKNGDAPELAAAMARLEKAFADDQRTSDPIERLVSTMRLQDEVARAAEVLRSYDRRFTSTQTAGRARASRALPGAREQKVTFTADGIVGEPLARHLPGLGLEKRVLLPGDIAALPTTPKGLAIKLAKQVAGWQRSHLIGPGFGQDMFEGLMLAPESVNQEHQNKVIERLARRAAEMGREVRVQAEAEGRRIILPVKPPKNQERMRGDTTEYVDVLTRVEYRVTVTPPGQVITYLIKIGKPPAGETKVDTNLTPDQLEQLLGLDHP